MMDKKNEKSKPDLIGHHGGYRNLKSYQTAEIIYDATAVFCDFFVDKYSRTHDQMVQATRSGKQNIAEGSMVSGTSKKSELKLIGIARASLEEANYLLDQQLRQLGKQFLKEGGFTEKLYQGRQQAKNK
jgi:four helix bundle suffix protein